MKNSVMFFWGIFWNAKYIIINGMIRRAFSLQWSGILSILSVIAAISASFKEKWGKNAGGRMGVLFR